MRKQYHTRRKRIQIPDMRVFCYEEVETATKGFALQMLIGKGSHGHVYKGVLDGGKLLVAVKRPAAGLQKTGGEVAAKLSNEISILSSISSSPHIVRLVGVVSGAGGDETGSHNKVMMMVIEFMPNGSLHDLLHSSTKPPTWSCRAVLAHQVAMALQALHEATPPVVHRDVKSSNILMDSLWTAKLADFSLAVRDTAACRPTAAPPPAGTIGYLDPCYTGPSKLGTETDVFSFGVVLLELVTGRRAMDPARDTTSVVAWASPLLRDGAVAELRDPRMELTSMAEIRSVARVLRLAARCISLDREKRPAAGEIVAELRMVVKRLRRPVRSLSQLKVSSISKRIRGCVNAWRTKARVTATTRIVCTDHLHEDEEENGNLDCEKKSS